MLVLTCFGIVSQGSISWNEINISINTKIFHHNQGSTFILERSIANIAPVYQPSTLRVWDWYCVEGGTTLTTFLSFFVSSTCKRWDMLTYIDDVLVVISLIFLFKTFTLISSLISFVFWRSTGCSAFSAFFTSPPQFWLLVPWPCELRRWARCCRWSPWSWPWELPRWCWIREPWSSPWELWWCSCCCRWRPSPWLAWGEGLCDGTISGILHREDFKWSFSQKDQTIFQGQLPLLRAFLLQPRQSI